MDALDKYVNDLSSPEAALLHELERETFLRVINPHMISGHVQGKFLEMIVRMLRPHRVLEIGTFTGYSALSMAAGLADDALLDTCEADDELEDMIRSFLDRSEHVTKIRLHIGSALDIVPTLGEVYDLVFIDGDKREYIDYYNMLMDNGLVRSGSYIMADNILWYGKVAQPIDRHDKQTQVIDAFNRMVLADERVENVIIPVRDGINMIRVK